MSNKKTLSLFKLIQNLGVDKAQEFLRTSFRCSKNLDIENFLFNKAIRFEQANASATHFIVNDVGEILAYFSLTFDSVKFSNISNSLRKKLTGGLTQSDVVKVFLIGQIGKNDIADNPLRLADILDVAFQKIVQAKRLISGRVVILECENHPKLISLYQTQGFKMLETQDNEILKTLFIIPDIQ